MVDWRQVLVEEFAAEPGSFLLALRDDLTWDTKAFERLTSAMEACCLELAKDENLERSLAAGFWYLGTFPQSWTSHDSWLAQPNRDEIDRGLERLWELAEWFFTARPVRDADATGQ